MDRIPARHHMRQVPHQCGRSRSGQRRGCCAPGHSLVPAQALADDSPALPPSEKVPRVRCRSDCAKPHYLAARTARGIEALKPPRIFLIAPVRFQDNEANRVDRASPEEDDDIRSALEYTRLDCEGPKRSGTAP